MWAGVSSNGLLRGSKDSDSEVQATNREIVEPGQLDDGVDRQAMLNLQMQHYGGWVFPWDMGLDEFAHRYCIGNDEGMLHVMALCCESLAFPVQPLAYHFAELFALDEDPSVSMRDALVELLTRMGRVTVEAQQQTHWECITHSHE